MADVSSMSYETIEFRLVRRLVALPLPVICAVNGVAAGAGVNIALACDLVLARRSAKFVQAFGAIGLIPDAGGTWSLPHLSGRTGALQRKCGLSEDYKEGVSAFKARRTPSFTGR